jgi:hypothetical protein
MINGMPSCVPLAEVWKSQSLVAKSAAAISAAVTKSTVQVKNPASARARFFKFYPKESLVTKNSSKQKILRNYVISK